MKIETKIKILRWVARILRFNNQQQYSLMIAEQQTHTPLEIENIQIQELQWGGLLGHLAHENIVKRNACIQIAEEMLSENLIHYEKKQTGEHEYKVRVKAYFVNPPASRIRNGKEEG